MVACIISWLLPDDCDRATWIALSCISLSADDATPTPPEVCTELVDDGSGLWVDGSSPVAGKPDGPPLTMTHDAGGRGALLVFNRRSKHAQGLPT